MSRYSKQIIAALSSLVVLASGHFMPEGIQASQSFESQTAQSSPNSQPTATQDSQSQPMIEWIERYPSAAVLIVAVLLYIGVLWRYPIWLLLLPLDKIPKVGMFSEIPIPPAIGSFLKYRPRVLDAWVEQRISQAQAEFNQRRTVGERSVHIPIPVEFNGNKQAIVNFSASDLKAVFSKQSTRLLIVGEGGVGKTSLACQIAKWAMAEDRAERLCRHRMLPVLIEEELESGEGKSPVLDAIARQIKNLRDEEKPISEELLKQLLEKRRILVIVDHLSEMSEATRNATGLRDANSPINALIVTSRIEDILGKEVTHTTIKPQRISGDKLWIFMTAYLAQGGKSNLFSDSELFYELSRLSQIVTNECDITVLFAKLYADQMVAAAEGSTTEELPNNVPDLMLNYINEVNKEKDSKIDDAIVQRDLKIIAWECLKETLKPETAEREQVIKCLSALENESSMAKHSAQNRLQYLEERLGLIRTVPPAKTKIRFGLDPLAEYLAGLYLVECYGEDEQAWRTFLNEVVENNSGLSEEIHGFLLALRDCYISRRIGAKEYDFIIEELNRLLGLDLSIIEDEQLRKEIQFLIFRILSSPNYNDRSQAGEELWSIRSELKADEFHKLTKGLKHKDPSVRSIVTEILGASKNPSTKITDSLLMRLDDEHEELEIKLTTAYALHKLGVKPELLTSILLSILQSPDKSIRKDIMLLLGEIGCGEEVISALQYACESEENDFLKEVARKALGQIFSKENLIGH